MKTFQLKYAGTVAVLVIAASTLLWSANTPLTATWAASGHYTQGVLGLAANGDIGDIAYVDGEGSVRCYFGVGGKNVVLLTYSNRANPDPRMLHFVAASEDVVDFQALGLPAVFDAEVDFFGPSHGGAYTAMTTSGAGSVVWLHADLEFHYSATNTVTTYEFAYSSLAAIRKPGNIWLITSDPTDIPVGSSVIPSDTAVLKEVRRKNGRSTTVNMPIRFEVSQ